MTIVELSLGGRWEELALVAKKRFGVEVDLRKLEESVGERFRINLSIGQPHSWFGRDWLGEQWSQSYQEHWLRNRLEESGAFPEPGCNPGITEGVVSCLFHVGFLSIMEKPEELARLRNDRQQIKRDDVARSKIFAALPSGGVRPIDRVAARVARDPISARPLAGTEER